jgi:hypothetical protein
MAHAYLTGEPLMTAANAPLGLPLRTVLLVDAATCALMGVVLVAAATALAPLLALPRPLLVYAGVILFPTAAFITWAATRGKPPEWATALVIAGNVIWIVASAALLAGPWVSPNLPGNVFIGTQAIGVGALTTLEWMGVKRG